MTTNRRDTRVLENELQRASLYFMSGMKEPQGKAIDQVKGNQITQSRDTMREKPSGIPRERTQEYPGRDEIQEFSFRMRDELKVKVQAEVPHQWQEELEEISRKLKVKKLELYRFILGEFLGKVTRKGDV